MPFGLSQLVFGNPALWVGVLGLGIPVLIHLLTRRTPRKLIFPTIQFIRKAQASQSAIFRVRHLLMLIVRTLLILLVLLAFLRPVAHSGLPPAKKGDKAQKALVVLLDISASMGYSGGGVTPLSRALPAAEKIVGGLGGGDLANLVLAGATPKTSFDTPSDNRFHLRRDIQAARATLERANIDAALAEAVRQLAGVPEARHELVCISDFQRTNWAAVNFGMIPKSIRVVFIPVGEKHPENVAITEITLQPPSPTVGESVEVFCRVANYGPEFQNVPVKLQFQNEPPSIRAFAVDAGMTATAVFRVRAQKKGLFEGVLSVPDDGLAADNKRFFSFQVAEQMRILLVTDEDPKDFAASHRFLARAVNPYSESRLGAALATQIGVEDLDLFALARSQLVLMSGPRELSRKNATLLVEYLKNGDSLVYFLSGASDAFNLKLLVEVSNGDFVMPFIMRGSKDRGAGGDFATLSEANFDHPLLRSFRDSGNLGDPHFYRYFATERVKQQGRVFLKYDDGNIAMAEKTVGIGSILLCNFSFSLTHSDFAKHTLFVPFVQETIKNQRPAAGGMRNYEVGFPCATTVALERNDETIEFKNPSGERVNASLEMGQKEAAVFFPKTEESGFYRIYRKDEAIGSVAVNLNALESNLESLTVGQLEELTQMSRERFYAATGGNLSTLQEMMEGRPLWHYFLMCALCLMGIEQILGLYWRR